MDFTIHKGKASKAYIGVACFGSMRRLAESVTYDPNTYGRVKNPTAVSYKTDLSGRSAAHVAWVEYLLKHPVWGGHLVGAHTPKKILSNTGSVKVSAALNPHALVQTLSMYRVTHEGMHYRDTPLIFSKLVAQGAHPDAAAYCALLLSERGGRVVLLNENTESNILSPRCATVHSLQRYVHEISAKGCVIPYYDGTSRSYHELMSYHRNESDTTEGLAGWLTEYVDSDDVTDQLIHQFSEPVHDIIYDKEKKEVISHSVRKPEIPATDEGYAKLAARINKLAGV